MEKKTSKVRELATQILFLWDAQALADDETARLAIKDFTKSVRLRERALAMARGAWEQRETADRWVERVAPQWPTHRQPSVDRNLLRLAVWEMINTSEPAKVVIDQAIELAKYFSTDQSASFVNGVLDAILKEHQKMKGTEARSDEGAKGNDSV